MMAAPTARAPTTTGRPAGEVRQALMRAACELVPTIRARSSGAHQGATLQELAEHAGVGYDAARNTVSNMRQAGALTIVSHRKVEHRNRPVAEYLPTEEVPEGGRSAGGFMVLDYVVNGWAR